MDISVAVTEHDVFQYMIYHTNSWISQESIMPSNSFLVSSYFLSQENVGDLIKIEELDPIGDDLIKIEELDPFSDDLINIEDLDPISDDLIKIELMDPISDDNGHCSGGVQSHKFEKFSQIAHLKQHKLKHSGHFE